MLADFYIPKLSNDMKNTIHNNDLMGLILDIFLDRSKNGVYVLLLQKFSKIR